MDESQKIQELRETVQKLSRIHLFHQELNFTVTENDALNLFTATLMEIFDPSFLFILRKTDRMFFQATHSLGERVFTQYLDFFKGEIEDFLGAYPELPEEIQETRSGGSSFLIQSSFTVPLIFENSFLGMVSLGHSRFSYFNTDDIELASLLSLHLAQKIASIAFREELNRANQKLSTVNQELSRKVFQFSALNTAGQKIARSRSSEEIRELVLEALEKSGPFKASSGRPGELEKRFPDCLPILRQCAGGNRSFFNSSITTVPGGPMACLPLVRDDQDSELLLVLSAESGTLLTSDDREFFSLLSQQFSQSLQNARNMEQSRKTTLDRELKLSSLFHLSELLSSIFNRPELSQKIVRSIRQVMRAESCVLLLVENDSLIIQAF
ncbi:MAG: GAF domain-containing protein, partial [Candidatus Wallbacteria bacterium]|nr:GAF domain-containing protein [Candidatus Wallbacteria bacterium]